MKNTYLFVGLLMLIFNFSNAQKSASLSTSGLKKAEKKVINDFINLLKTKNVTKLRTMVAYPLKRQYPLADVKNAKDFHSRYNYIIDSKFRGQLISSNVDKDWKSMGSKGIMFGNGDLWLDASGKIIAINYQSNIERGQRKKLIDMDKRNIHPTLRNFDEPILVMKTAQQQIRIDKLADGKYRYAAWPATAKFNTTPTLAISGGSYVPEGSGGNHKYEFTNKGSVYECFINVIGASKTPEAELVISKNGTVQSTFPAQLVKK